MATMETVRDRLEQLGVKHAPLQQFLNSDNVDGRYVTLIDPPGAYYILGDDNMPNREKREELIQLIFLGVPDDSKRLAMQIGWRITNSAPLPSDQGPIPSVFLGPV